MGDLIGASLAIGVEPWPPSYYWPVDEPLVAQLPDNAWLRGPNWEITAGQVKRKIYPSCRWSRFLDPSLLEDPRAIVVDATPAWATTPTTSLTTTTVESTGPTTTSVLALDIPSENAGDVATAPAPVEGGWLDLWWVLLTVGGAAYLAMRRAEPPAAADLLVVEDDVTEPNV
ncbi:MAG TPA: hypothetical protein VM848_13560 [Acidimicrobiia bacterium]|nr:hypothetical protein [Acidimicrobiia bacterium]